MYTIWGSLFTFNQDKLLKNKHTEQSFQDYPKQNVEFFTDAGKVCEVDIFSDRRKKSQQVIYSISAKLLAHKHPDTLIPPTRRIVHTKNCSKLQFPSYLIGLIGSERVQSL